MYVPPRRKAIAVGGVELANLRWPGAKLEVDKNEELRFFFTVRPSLMGRSYQCLLKVPRRGFPVMIVLKPDLKLLAGERRIPHTYRHEGKGTCLCLWLPRAKEWTTKMRLDQTYLPWTAQWLDYFEEWLETGSWAGGGVHPDLSDGADDADKSLPPEAVDGAAG